MKLVSPKSSAHWYSRDAKPLHTVTGANGLERSTTLRDARKLDLLPSVTSVLSVLAKPGLEAWKQEQAILAALTLPRLPQEGDDAFAKRVVSDMEAQVERAANFGTLIHASIEQVNSSGTTAGIDAAVRPWLERYDAWRRANLLRTLRSEEILVHAGYAGRFDLLAEHQEHGTVLIDFKTQNVKGGKAKTYETWGYQLAAYRHALGIRCHCLSVIIDSNQPTDPVEKLWEEEELENGLEVFKAALEIWQRQRGYVPAALIKKKAA